MKTTTARGYGAAHQRARRDALKALQDGDPCSRCGRPMYRGQDLDLDHTDDRTGYRGLAHRRCNQIAGAKKGGRITARRRHPTARAIRTAVIGWQSRNW